MTETIVTEWPKEFAADDELMKGVALSVIEKARRFNHSIVLYRNGKIEEISPDEAERRLARRK